MEANSRAFRAGWNDGETSEDFAVSYEIAPAPLAPGTYRQITGNTAISYGLIAAAKLAKLPLFLGAYPITPASSILEELAGKKEFGVVTFQAEDEIAAVGAAVGAAFGGALGVTASAGPGVVLKAETVGLAIALELPLLILDIQRAGPSTGMPTKPEQADLLMVPSAATASSPVPVVAASTPSQCFEAAIEAARIALKYRTPAPPLRRLPRQRLRALAHPGRRGPAGHLDELRRGERRAVRAVPPRSRDARPSVGDPRHPAGLEHRIGGLEKADVTGAISYDPDNHDVMVRAAGAEGGGDRGGHPRAAVDDPDGRGSSSWSAGDRRPDHGRRAARAAAGRPRRAGPPRSTWYPLPRNTADVLRRYDKC